MLLSNLLNVVDSNTLVKIIDVGEFIPKYEVLFEGYAASIFENVELKNTLDSFFPCTIKPIEGRLEILVY